MRRIHGGLAALAAALGLWGCGAGGVTQRQLIMRADAICERTLADVRARPSAGTQVVAIVPLIAREVSQLVALPRPAEHRALLTRYLTAMRAELGDWRRLAGAQASHSAPAVSAAVAALRADPAPSLAARYGLGDCATAGATVGSAASSG
jgi:hypothetical protein